MKHRTALRNRNCRNDPTVAAACALTNSTSSPRTITSVENTNTAPPIVPDRCPTRCRRIWPRWSAGDERERNARGDVDGERGADEKGRERRQLRAHNRRTSQWKGPEHHRVAFVEHERVPDEDGEKAGRDHRVRHKEHRQLRETDVDRLQACCGPWRPSATSRNRTWSSS